MRRQMYPWRGSMRFCIMPFSPVRTVTSHFEDEESVTDRRTSSGFLFYCFFVIVFATVMIYWVAPKHGRRNPMIYLSICSTVGSISICAVKGLGIALKLTFGGSNQLTNPSTYVFLIVTVVAIMTQMNYFNKALSHFSTNMCVPNPLLPLAAFH